MDREWRNIDLSLKSFDEFVAFFFEREVVKLDPPNNSFVANLLEIDRLDEAVPSSPEIIVRYMTRLFREFGQIASRYSLPQLDQGIWNLLGPRFETYSVLWDSSIPIPMRLERIRSMYSVYSEFVSKSDATVMEDCFDMWWDLLGHEFWGQVKLFEAGVKIGEVDRLDSDSRAILDAMFETLARILELPDARTQGYALHGLGHLHHPAVWKTVQEYIDGNRAELTERGLRWVEQCRDCTVM